MAIEIIATGRAVPPRRVTNDDLAERLDTSDEWIRSHTGIGARHIVDDGIAVSDLALDAARNALNQAVEERLVQETSVEDLAGTLDLIILGTSTPDYQVCPATACIIQDKLGASHAGAMDIGVGCSGFVYSLETAAGLLELQGGRKRALVIGAETLSLFVDWNDRSSCILFGDGAGAFFIEKTSAPREGPGKRGLIKTILGSDGAGAENLIVRKGGSRNAYRAGDTLDTTPHLEMDGRAVYNFAVKKVCEILEQLLSEENLTIDAVDRIVPHQANARIIQAAAKRLGIPEEKFFMNIEDYANTSAASIPIALDELNRSGGLRRGDLLLIVGFGAGLAYGGSLIVW
ncbi:MAG: ketoacyl-ACP synthase III [Spirochaetaceae bacterium]|jgi:3-oxoacyl-[acyl-carrier-protein] synthase-3|nr:ketoacyl-ACP synthase III [Spirochaetaceae bacterium]